MSQAIGAAVSSVRVANLLGSLAIMMFLLFGGFLLNRDQVPWYCTWIADLSYFNYAYEALAVRPAICSIFTPSSAVVLLSHFSCANEALAVCDAMCIIFTPSSAVMLPWHRASTPDLPYLDYAHKAFSLRASCGVLPA